MEGTQVAILLAAASSVFAAIAALVNLYQGVLTRKHIETEIFFRLRDRYLSKEMDDAQAVLWAWYRAHGDAFIDSWISLKESDKRKFEELSRARRIVSRYFIDIARLYLNGQISRRVARMVTAVTGIHCFFRICLPMGERHGTHYSPEYVKVMKKIRDSYKSGELD